MLVDLPHAMDIRQRDDQGRYAPEPGVVDAYRWISFYLEGDEESARVLFNKVIDPEWLYQRTMRTSLPCVDPRTNQPPRFGESCTE